jgi:hypothetical protein
VRLSFSPETSVRRCGKNVCKIPPSWNAEQGITGITGINKKARFLCGKTGFCFSFLLFRSKTRFPPFGDNNDPHAKQQDGRDVYNRDLKTGYHSFSHVLKILLCTQTVKIVAVFYCGSCRKSANKVD